MLTVPGSGKAHRFIIRAVVTALQHGSGVEYYDIVGGGCRLLVRGEGDLKSVLWERSA